MRNFFKVAEVDVIPLAHALAVKPHLWNANPIRTTFPGSPHSDCDDILLWFNNLSDDIPNDIQTHPQPAWDELPQVRQIIFDLMRRVEGVQLGRALITRLAPGKTIPEHPDAGAPATFYQRYQIAIQCLPGCNFRIGDEVVNFRMGDVWWIDNQVPHEVINNSADDRIALVVDVRTA